MHWESFTCYITSWQPWTAPYIGKYEIQTAERWMRHIDAPLKQSMGWNNAKEQVCNQCSSHLSRYLWFTYESGGIFPTSSVVARSRFLVGVAITNISMQLALLYSELGYLTYNPTSRHGLQLSPWVSYNIFYTLLFGITHRQMVKPTANLSPRHCCC